MWDDVCREVHDHPTTVKMLEMLLEYIREERHNKIENALINEEAFLGTKAYCSGLEFIAGRIKTLISEGKKNVGT